MVGAGAQQEAFLLLTKACLFLPPVSGCQRVGMFQRRTGAPSTPTVPLAQTGVKAWGQAHGSGGACHASSSPLSKAAPHPSTG